MWFFPMAAAAVAAVFGALLAQRFLSRQRPHQAAWATALFMFAIASFAAGVGVLGGWSEVSYRTYYLFGAILNVPFLGLGTVYLLGPRKLGHAVALLILVASIFAAGAVFTASIDGAALARATTERQIAAASEVMPMNVRELSRYYSWSGFVVVVVGALWSSWKLARDKKPHLRNLAAGNILIAAGTMVVAVASGFARFGQGSVFSVGLLAGILLMFWGFLKTRAEPQAPQDTAAGSEGG